MADEPAHFITVLDVTNGPRVRVPHYGRVYSQQSLVCLCGWRMITIRQLTDMFVQRHMAGRPDVDIADPAGLHDA